MPGAGWARELHSLVDKMREQVVVLANSGCERKATSVRGRWRYCARPGAGAIAGAVTRWMPPSENDVDARPSLLHHRRRLPLCRCSRMAAFKDTRPKLHNRTHHLYLWFNGQAEGVSVGRDGCQSPAQTPRTRLQKMRRRSKSRVQFEVSRGNFFLANIAGAMMPSEKPAQGSNFAEYVRQHLCRRAGDACIADAPLALRDAGNRVSAG